MYPTEETHRLQKLTTQLLKSLSLAKINAGEINDLRKVLRFHEHRYYFLSDPLISDFEYDQLYKQLQNIEKENPGLITADSPTQRVASSLTKDFPSVQHLVPMLSLDNSYNSNDLIDFDRKARELTGLPVIEYCVEPKFDGASISLVYENDMLLRGVTRGNGVVGDDVTPNIRQVHSIPLSAKFSDHHIQTIEIRGEVMINKNNFKKYNEQIIEQGFAPLANPRNAASGSLRIKDPAEVKRRNLEAFLYSVSYFIAEPKKNIPPALMKHSASLDLLWQLGFRIPVNEKKVFSGIQPVIDYCTAFEHQRDELPYEIDGMVIKVNDTALQDKLGMTSHHPRWAIAFKFKARQATSKLLKVEFQVGRTGSITPVAKIEPAPIGGITITSISLFNEDVIREKDLRIGDTVLVERAGDVIPYIVKPLTELRTGNEEKIIFPTHCPVCNDALYKPEEEAAWRCININCPAQVVEKIIHFVSKNAMDIRGLGEANIRRFYDEELLKNIPGIYQLDFKRLAQMERFGIKSIDKLQAAIENSKSQPLHRLIFALGIRYVGETTAKVLAQEVNHLFDFKNYSEEALQQLEDIGPKVAGSIYQFFANRDNIEMLETLEALGLQLANSKKQFHNGGNLQGLTFLFTGTLPTLKRSDAEEMVEKNGGKIAGGVSSKLDYLVVGEDAGSKLEKAKKTNTIKIISEKEFLEIIEKK
ncbi:MAG TPA: NAD-dependent DNA ligase LigA [Chitinophagaceae bacterium]